MFAGNTWIWVQVDNAWGISQRGNWNWPLPKGILHHRCHQSGQRNVQPARHSQSEVASTAARSSNSYLMVPFVRAPKRSHTSLSRGNPNHCRISPLLPTSTPKGPKATSFFPRLIAIRVHVTCSPSLAETERGSEDSNRFAIAPNAVFRVFIQHLCAAIRMVDKPLKN